MEIAYDRLKHDFFEKRYEIYIAAKKFIKVVYKEAPVNPADPEIKNRILIGVERTAGRKSGQGRFC